MKAQISWPITKRSEANQYNPGLTQQSKDCACSVLSGCQLGNQQDTLTWKTLCSKSLEFYFSYFCLVLQISLNFLIFSTFFARQFLMFFFEILHGKSARGRTEHRSSRACAVIRKLIFNLPFSFISRLSLTFRLFSPDFLSINFTVLI